MTQAIVTVLATIAAALGLPAPAAATPDPVATAGAHVVAPLPGPEPGAAFLASVRRGEVGGVIVFSWSYSTRDGLARSLAAVRRAARAGGRPAPLVLVDQEGGSVRRLPWAAPVASAATLAAGGTATVRAAGRAAGRDLRALGIQVDLAPVADVGWPGSFLDSRAFGATPAAVTPAVVAFVRGLHDGRAAASLKHFPGLGRARTSTDGGRIVVAAPRRALARDLVPFRAGIAAGADLVMVASAAYPALDASGAPAALSRRIVDGLLRRGLGFDGVVVTDALDTAALAGERGLLRRAGLAGVDLLLYTEVGAARGAARRLAAQAAADPVLARRLAASDRRLAALRRRLGLRV